MRINSLRPATMSIEFGSWVNQDRNMESEQTVDISKGYKKYCVDLAAYISYNGYVPPIWLTFYVSSTPYITCAYEDKVITINHEDPRCYTSLSACESSNLFPFLDIECE